MIFVNSTPTSKTTLCVVDMQPYFSKTALRCLNEVLIEIKKAKRRNAAIVILEYDGLGPSYDEIDKLIEGYPHCAITSKSLDGGGEELLNELECYNWPADKVRFVGVNRSYCVRSTVKEFLDLTKKNNVPSQVEIVARATWCEYPSSGLRGLKKLGKVI